MTEKQKSTLPVGSVPCWFLGVNQIDVLESFFTALAGADAEDVEDVEDGDLAVADFAGVGYVGDGLDDGVQEAVGNEDLDFGLRKEVHGVFAATVDFRVAALSAESFDFSDGHSMNADFTECVLNVVEFMWLDDGFDLFHMFVYFDVCLIVG